MISLQGGRVVKGGMDRQRLGKPATRPARVTPKGQPPRGRPSLQPRGRDSSFSDACSLNTRVEQGQENAPADSPRCLSRLTLSPLDSGQTNLAAHSEQRLGSRAKPWHPLSVSLTQGQPMRHLSPLLTSPLVPTWGLEMESSSCPGVSLLPWSQALARVPCGPLCAPELQGGPTAGL